MIANDTARSEQSERTEPQDGALRALLGAVPLFADVPEDHFDWLLMHGEDICVAPGELLVREGAPADWFFILLEGEFQVTKQVGGQETFLDSYQAGIYFGEVPLLLNTTYMATGHGLTACRLLRLHKDDFWLMLSRCQWITKAILQTMAWRVQNIQIVSQQHSKLMALGTLAAGLAHELNNPASAARRATDLLGQSLERLQSQTLTLCRLQLDITQRQALDTTQRQAMEQAKTPPVLDTLAQSDREDAVTAWLEAGSAKVENAWELAPTLVRAGFDSGRLDAFAAQVPPAALPDCLRWLEASLTVVELIGEVDHSTERISELVQAIKDYSYMDQAPLQEIEVHGGLESTLTMLGHKLRQHRITVNREYDCEMPRICAYGSELNQVWTNLIDNAIDAMGEGGNLRLRTSRENDVALVEVMDSGSGIPDEALPHIFEPFYTTKGVGDGTGLGLDIAYRIVVNRHKGSVRVVSKPGDTRFQIRLPFRMED